MLLARQEPTRVRIHDVHLLFVIIETMNENVTRIGVGLLIVRGNKILMGKRKNAHGPGTYAGPGGNLGYMESPKDALLREFREECGDEIQISDPKLLCVVHWEEYKPIHYIGICFVADYISGEPMIMEPEKIENWDWYELDNLPSPLFGVMKSYLKAYRENTNYLEA